MSSHMPATCIEVTVTLYDWSKGASFCSKFLSQFSRSYKLLDVLRHISDSTFVMGFCYSVSFLHNDLFNGGGRLGLRLMSFPIPWIGNGVIVWTFQAFISRRSKSTLAHRVNNNFAPRVAWDSLTKSSSGERNDIMMTFCKPWHHQ